MATLHEQYMQRALELAERGRGWVSPNPLVGCVIVRNEKIIGEGYHARYGGNHAEVNALEDARQHGHDACGATLYVTLEPCHHWGNTPPCTDAIIHAGIQRVFFASRDPNPHVCGGGQAALRKSGIPVVVGLRAKAARQQNKIFFHWATTRRPYVCAKAAVSNDGKITRALGTRTRISGETSQQFVHTLRRQYDAILVGVETVLIDDPELTVRFGEQARQPLRIILDSRLRIPLTARVFADRHCLLVTTHRAPKNRLDTLAQQGEVMIVPSTETGHVALPELLRSLADRKITSLLVEGGQKIFTSFFDQHLVDEWIFVRSPILFGSGLDFITAPHRFFEQSTLRRTEPMGQDTIEYWLQDQ